MRARKRKAKKEQKFALSLSANCLLRRQTTKVLCALQPTCISCGIYLSECYLLRAELVATRAQCSPKKRRSSVESKPKPRRKSAKSESESALKLRTTGKFVLQLLCCLLCCNCASVSQRLTCEADLQSPPKRKALSCEQKAHFCLFCLPAKTGRSLFCRNNAKLKLQNTSAEQEEEEEEEEKEDCSLRRFR